MEQIGDRIRIVRKCNQLTQKKFGDSIGVSYGHISNIEKNKDIPSETIIKLICYEYRISENWLKTGTGEMIDNNRNLQSSNKLVIMLDDIFVSSTETNRKKISSIVTNLELILLNNNQLALNSQHNNLDILNNIMDTIYSVTNLLITAKEKKYQDFDEIKLDEYLDNIFEKFSVLIEHYKDELDI